jgi:class 3 adenylate cyclase
MAACRECGSELPAGARFCPACGTAAAARRGVERKVVTVLFADIADLDCPWRRSATPRMSALPSARKWRGCARKIERYGGTFEQVTSAITAVMAVFGAPIAHEDDPERPVLRGDRHSGRDFPDVKVSVATGEALASIDATPGTVRELRQGTS